MKLEWDEECDDDDNTVHSAASPYHDDGSPFRWRISPVVREDRLVWTLDGSDAECMPDDDEHRFTSLDEAKATCQRWCDEIIESERKGGGVETGGR